MAREKNQYKRIQDRTDGKRPEYFHELIAKHPHLKDCFVMKVKFLTPKGSTLEMTWSEKEADSEQRKKQDYRSGASSRV